MTTKKFDTPFGLIEVLKNDTQTDFEIETGGIGYEAYPLNDGTSLKPDGLYLIKIKISSTLPDDSIIVKYSTGKLKPDGGDERTMNAICENDDYTFGFGWADTEDIELGYRYWFPELYENGKRKRILPYEAEGIEESGICFHIVGDCSMYEDLMEEIQKEAREICVVAAWVKSSTPYAHEIISYVTC